MKVELERILSASSFNST